MKIGKILLSSVVVVIGLSASVYAASFKVEGVPIKIGDTVENVQKALKTDLEPQKIENQFENPMRPSNRKELRLKTKGIWVFFERDKVYTIRVDKPFPGNVGGVKLGDSSGKIEKVFGPPIKRSTFGKSNTFTYYSDDITTTRFDVNQDDEIESIFFIK